MSVFGPTPMDPRGPQAALAAQPSALRPHERGRPAVETGKRMKDAQEKRVAGTESDAAVRSSADEHADADSQGRKRDRRDGQRDAFVASAPPQTEMTSETASTTTAGPTNNKRPPLDLKA